MYKQNKGMTIEECLQAADETKELILKADAAKEIPKVLSAHFNNAPVSLLIADTFTYEAIGEKVQSILENENIAVKPYIFPGKPTLHADYDYVKTIISALSAIPDYKNRIPLAIGGGTINDLVKRAAFELEIPYICVPTASSVDGYTANGASLLGDGFKQVFPCSAPKAVVADTEVLAKAPAYLSSSGFGDLASKVIAGTDWIIADKASLLKAPGAEALDEKAWSMTQPGLLDVLDKSINAVKGDKEAIKILFGALAVTGFAMQYFKNSRPVSGAEHAFSHIWEMENLSVDGVPVTHGHKVAIGTLAATAFTEIFFADSKGPPAIPKSFKRPSKEERETEVSLAFEGSSAQKSAVATALKKYMEEDQAKKINELFYDTWKEIRDCIMERLLPYSELKSLLERGGCPIKPEDINLVRSKVIATARKAQMVRVRYGVLDIAWNIGTFEGILSRMEDSAIYLH